MALKLSKRSASVSDKKLSFDKAASWVSGHMRDGRRRACVGFAVAFVAEGRAHAAGDRDRLVSIFVSVQEVAAATPPPGGRQVNFAEIA
jgi:hypothetical protein